MVAFAVVSFYMGTREEVNPFTGETQRVSLTVDQEVALGLQSVGHMTQQFGGLLPDPEAQAMIDKIGQRLVRSNEKVLQSGYNFEFHLLADPDTVNAFALPGGQVFFTTGLLKRLKTEDEVAGVLGHEIGHVIGRHSNEQMAKSKFVQGVLQAGVAAASDSYQGAQVSSQIAGFVGQLINTRYGRDDESESDAIGFTLLVDAGYDPAAMLGVMRALKSAAAGQNPPEFLSSHPLPETRIRDIERYLEEYRAGEKSPF